MDSTRKCSWTLQKNSEWIPNRFHEKVSDYVRFCMDSLKNFFLNGFHKKDFDGSREKDFEGRESFLEILHEKVFNGFHEKDFEEITHLLLV